MKVSEKTLELNLTFEMLSLADQLWSLIQFATSAPRVMRGCHCYRPSRMPPLTRPPFALGLSLQDEKRQGWDVSIEFPAGHGKPTHALFLQFKAGKHKDYSTDHGSVFHGSTTRRRPFCEFEFNNNSGNDQHVILRTLANQPNLRGAVAYVFPRVANIQTFKACIGRLIHVTSVYTVAEIDSMAAARGVTIARGSSHKMRTSYTSPARIELCSEPVSLEGIQPSDGSLFADVVATRVFRTLSEWKHMLREHWNSMDHHQVNWAELFKSFEIEVGRYLAISANSFSEATQSETWHEEERALNEANEEFESFRRIIKDMTGAAPKRAEFDRERDPNSERPREEDGVLLPEIAREEMMREVSTRLSPYRELLSSPNWIEALIPEPKTKMALPLRGDEQINLSSLSDQHDESQLESMLGDVSFQAI